MPQPRLFDALQRAGAVGGAWDASLDAPIDALVARYRVPPALSSSPAGAESAVARAALAEAVEADEVRTAAERELVEAEQRMGQLRKGANGVWFLLGAVVLIGLTVLIGTAVFF